jgi:hephaestin
MLTNVPPPNPQNQVFVETNEGTLGSKYRKAVFRGYTDATFKTPAPREELFGILGPTIRAEPGDKIMVHFLNRLPFSASLQVCGGYW